MVNLNSIYSNVKFLILISITLKVLLIPAYRSTDFEVHRNWLAITNSLPIQRWYYENTSEWTLDYPPFFAYFEYALSKPAEYLDRNMLNVTNLNYASEATIIYQRLTIIISEFTLIYALYKFLSLFPGKVANSQNKLATVTQYYEKPIFLAVQLILNFGLILVDNIHFQYNGFLFGILLLSVYYFEKDYWHLGAFLFASLINFKHIFLYVAPAYFFYILKYYCFQSEIGVFRKFSRLVTIGFSTIIPFVLSLGPFILMGQAQQLISRLFPFKRGLCHAYWAPNFWSLYNTLDKFLAIAIKKLNFLNIEVKATTMTSGLVQDIDHQVLPQIFPLTTFLLSAVFMFLPIAYVLFRCDQKQRINKQALLILITLCGYSSFLFGWHVHEKAILMILLPFSLLAIENYKFANIYFMLSTIGNYSLFPLLFRFQEYPVKSLLWVLFTAYNYLSLKHQYKNKFNINVIEKFWLSLIFLIEIYNEIVHVFIGIDKRLPYLPLLLTSVYCAIGVFFYWLRLIQLVYLYYKKPIQTDYDKNK